MSIKITLLVAIFVCMLSFGSGWYCWRHSKDSAINEVKAAALDPHTRFIFGQELAAEYILAALTSHHEGTKPFVMLLAGPNGVGKSVLAGVVASGFYGAGSSYVLVINGKSYLGKSPREAGMQIFELMFWHLKSYPCGMVIIDELHTLHAETVQMVTPFLDDVHTRVLDLQSGYYIDTKDTFIILTSDFGMNQVDLDVPHDLQIENIIGAMRTIIRDPLAYQKVAHIIPVVRIPGITCNPKEVGFVADPVQEALRTWVENTVRETNRNVIVRTKTVNFWENVGRALLEDFLKKDCQPDEQGIIRPSNYRGLYQWVYFPKLQKPVVQKLARIPSCLFFCSTWELFLEMKDKKEDGSLVEVSIRKIQV